MDSTEEAKSGGYAVGALLRGLHILDMFNRERTAIGIGEMAKELDLHRSSASRLASTLASAGYLQVKGAQGTYELGPRLAVLGPLAGQNVDIERLVLPYLEHLSWVTGETGHLAQLDGKDSSTIAVTDGWHTVRMHSWPGKRTPAYCSSMGKVLLAGLGADIARSLYSPKEFVKRTESTVGNPKRLLGDMKEIAERGFALDDEELEVGLRCIAAPIANSAGEIDASMSISGPSTRIQLERLQQLQEHVRYAAWQASKARGATSMPKGWPEPPEAEPALLAWVENVRPPQTKTS